MAKVLHAADFHLDSAFRALPEEQARLRRQESRELPGRLVDWANDHGAQLMLLAGDLFDSDQLYSQTAQMLAQALSRFRGTVVIAPETIPKRRSTTRATGARQFVVHEALETTWCLAGS